MRRSGPPERHKAIGRGDGGLSRDSPLKRGTKAMSVRKQMNRARRRPATTTTERDLDEIARHAWQHTVKRWGCIMCRAFPPDVIATARFKVEIRHREAHHILAQRHLRRAGRHALLWDSDNGMCLCEYHHWRHEKAIQRVPRWLLPAAAIRFAERLGLGHHIDREYPR